MRYHIQNTRTTKEFFVTDLEEFIKKKYFIKKNYEDFMNEKLGNINLPILGEIGLGSVIRKTDKKVFKENYLNWVDRQYNEVVRLLSKDKIIQFRDLVIERED